MIMVTMSHDKACRIFTNDFICIKAVSMFVMVMTMCFFIMIIIVIMCWTWCYWRFTSQMILCCLDLFWCQIFLKEVMIVVTMSHDKACGIFTDNSIGIKAVSMFVMMITMCIFIMIIIVIMCWTWCSCSYTFQVILRCLNLICCQILLEEVMVMITMTHDKS